MTTDNFLSDLLVNVNKAIIVGVGNFNIDIDNTIDALWLNTLFWGQSKPLRAHAQQKLHEEVDILREVYPHLLRMLDLLNYVQLLHAWRSDLAWIVLKSLPNQAAYTGWCGKLCVQNAGPLLAKWVP